MSITKDMLAIAGRGNSPGLDIRDRLTGDHDSALAALDALGTEASDKRCLQLLRELRRGWMIHALAEETVVYRVLEGGETTAEAKARADERFIEHELVEGLFDKLSRCRPRSIEWHARVSVVRQLILRHIRTEENDLFVQLASRYDAAGLREMGRRFEMASEKLTMLEEAKAA